VSDLSPASRLASSTVPDARKKNLGALLILVVPIFGCAKARQKPKTQKLPPCSRISGVLE